MQETVERQRVKKVGKSVVEVISILLHNMLERIS
jgi:hypothetical protein